MSVGDIIVYVVAFAILFLIILSNWKSILRGTVSGAVVIAGIFVLSLVVFVGIKAWEYILENQTMQQCLTAYDRRAKADAAPNDYFGKQLRAAADEESKKCADFAAKKEAKSER